MSEDKEKVKEKYIIKNNKICQNAKERDVVETLLLLLSPHIPHD